MELWLKKNECTGCGACKNICPKNAISMVSDECGFQYPVIDKEKCIDCGLCKKTCPIINNLPKERYNVPIVYACWSKNEKNRFISTSGGMFSEIVLPIINSGGFAVGASYDKNNMVEHIAIEDKKGLEKLRQSKYLQSDTKDIYKKTKELLNKNKVVAFCGSPCQIAGLSNYLKKEYSNLLTIEFICRGMNSPKAYKSWLREIEEKENKKIVKVWFKYKKNGWKSSPKCTRIDFSDGSYRVYEGNENKFMLGYLDSNLYIRPSCGKCKFNGLPRQADITLADFWGINKELDDDKGTSLVIINSKKGEEYFNNIKDNISYYKKDIKDIYNGNVCFNNSVKINKKSKLFLKQLTDENFSYLLKKYSKISLVKKVAIHTKSIIKNFFHNLKKIVKYKK